MEVIQLHNSIIVTVLAIYNMNSEGNSVVVSLILTEHYQFIMLLIVHVLQIKI